MGCDIHFYVEKRVDGKWLPADKWEHDPDDENPKRLRTPWRERFYDGRNYSTFSILANVRNGRGFAGIKTGDGFNFISEPKGIPEDACPEYKQECEAYGSDGHSHSFLTVAEIMAFDWTQTSTIEGELDGETFEKWERWGRNQGENPATWCGSTSGPRIKHVSEDEMRQLIKAGADLTNTYTRCRWEQKYYQCAKAFLSETMPKLWRLGKPEDVRAVFFFDN